MTILLLIACLLPREVTAVVRADVCEVNSVGARPWGSQQLILWRYGMPCESCDIGRDPPVIDRGEAVAVYVENGGLPACVLVDEITRTETPHCRVQWWRQRNGARLRVDLFEWNVGEMR